MPALQQLLATSKHVVLDFQHKCVEVRRCKQQQIGYQSTLQDKQVNPYTIL